MPASDFHPTDEFDRQVQNLIELGYPALTGLSTRKLTALTAPLRAVVQERADSDQHAMEAPTPARVPFVVVVAGSMAPPDRSIELVALKGRPGFVSNDTADINNFTPVEAVCVPRSPAYLIFDVDRGKETLNATPDEAVARFSAEGRSPLTIDEGIAFLTAFPEALEKNNCFQTAGSRIGDRRVPGLWISDKRPKLGFCWAGNRHTWLGAASCADRAGAPPDPTSGQ